jgi:RNA polymerase sigma factor (sigma-70 family)
MPNSDVASIFEGLRSTTAQEAWESFLREYGQLILQTCQYSTSNTDQAADCFLFSCEQLSRNSFRRLLRFPATGPASFSTWLRVVVHNLCLDWHRKAFGRPRPFRSIARLSHLGGEVYRCRYERGLSLDDTFCSLQPHFPGLTREQLVSAEEQVQQSLSSRQRWLMSTRKAQSRIQRLECDVDVMEESRELMDPRPSQEAELADQEQEEQLRRAVSKLPKLERLLIHMRFEQDLSLQEIAALTGLGDAQRTHRRIAAVIEKLRAEIK